jgi:hypothetical protein
MEQLYSWSWVVSQVASTTALWNSCASRSLPVVAQFSATDQQMREDAYDKALETVEIQAKQARRGGARRADAHRQIVAVFPRFASVALGLEDGAVRLLADGFLPIGTQFAQWARRFDADLSMADTIQACRNAWTVCGLQPLLGDRMHMTPAIIGYSLLYPYSDNYLDDNKLTTGRKLEFSRRFRDRLCGLDLLPMSRHEAFVWAMVRLIEVQYPRQHYPRVYECLLAIHHAQENSIAQLKNKSSSEDELLRLSCAKGGTSVLADACLSHGSLTDQEARFAFDWGVLLQLGDDLQDVQEDLKHGSATIFSVAARNGIPLDDCVHQLLVFSERVADQIDQLPNGDPALNRLLRVSWRSLILMATARSHRFFSETFLCELESSSPFRFGFQRARHKRFAGSRGLYKVLFDSFLQSANVDLSHLPIPELWLEFALNRTSDLPLSQIATTLA